ncbi:YwiB family protein [Helicovermis profundi]|uniref:DUF1934 domain-containing protein n=1 Tax=Helicovermis profundi TaxID=3065157 RepID=A0AAU9E3D9_9FIRM|nr:DUF1934 domain-containing protein [Clostridia bacterium S502]
MECFIRVNSTIIPAKGEKQVIEFDSEAKIYSKNGSIYILYSESEISGMEGTKTLIKAKKDKVVLKRNGSNISELIFEKGINHSQSYITPYGNFLMETLTERIDLNINENLQGTLALEYELDIKSLGKSKYMLGIEIIKRKTVNRA